MADTLSACLARSYPARQMLSKHLDPPLRRATLYVCRPTVHCRPVWARTRLGVTIAGRATLHRRLVPLFRRSVPLGALSSLERHRPRKLSQSLLRGRPRPNGSSDTVFTRAGCVIDHCHRRGAMRAASSSLSLVVRSLSGLSLLSRGINLVTFSVTSLGRPRPNGSSDTVITRAGCVIHHRPSARCDARCFQQLLSSASGG